MTTQRGTVQPDAGAFGQAAAAPIADTLPPCPASSDSKHYADLILRDDDWTEVAAVCTECGYSRVFAEEATK